jgi:hypothetical protein
VSLDDAHIQSGIRVWQPEKVLPYLEPSEARYGSGFFCIDPIALVPTIASQWIPLAHTLGIEATLLECQAVASMPSGLTSISKLEIDGEVAYLGFEGEAEKVIADAVLGEYDKLTASLLLEYLERRFVTSLTRAWAGETPLTFAYVGGEVGTKTEVAAAIRIVFEVQSQNVTFYLGLGTRIVSEIDRFCREKLKSEHHVPKAFASRNGVLLSILLGDISVQTAELIDCLREGSLLSLESTLSDKVMITLEGEIWAEGVLRQYNGRYAVILVNFTPKAKRFSQSTTKIEIEVAQIQIERSALEENAHFGGVILTDSALGSIVSIIISGEHVADAVACELHGRATVKMLPK